MIVPKSGLEVQTGWLAPASVIAWIADPKPARGPDAGPVRRTPAALVSAPGRIFPAPSLPLDPPEWVEPAAPPADGVPVRLEWPSEPPLWTVLLALAPPPPVCANTAPALLFRPPLFQDARSDLPSGSDAFAIRAAALRLQAQSRLVSPALAPYPSALSAPPSVRGILDCPDPEPPKLRQTVAACSSSWPVLGSLVAVETSPARHAVAPCAASPQAIHAPAPDTLAPAVSRTLPQRQLRSAHHQLPLEVPAPAGLPLAPAAPPVDPASAAPSAAIPPLGLDLQPPEPLGCAPDAAGHVPSAGLQALGRAVAEGEICAGSVPEPALLQSEPPAPEPAEALTAVAPAPAEERMQPDPEPAPDLCRRLPMMPVRPVDSDAKHTPGSAASVCPCWSALDDLRPAHPSLRLELDHADGSGPRRCGDKRPSRNKLPKPRGKSRFWAHAPSDLKWIAVALPLLLVVVVYSFNAKKPNNPAGDSAMASTAAAPAASDSAQPWLKANAIQRFIMRRAGVRLFDDFRGGLGAWQGNDGWAKTWRYGDATFVQPGNLALLSSSLGLRDYTLTFLGQIERRSLNWVFRAKDLNNYYAMRIAVTRTGPLPDAVLVRTVVLDGREREVKTLPIPFPVQADTLYLVRMEVRGQDFTTYIQDQIVDHFTDSRLKSGGVGFYSPRGDRALLRWVEVSHQYDYLGRLCALLSPYGVQGLPAD